MAKWWRQLAPSTQRRKLSQGITPTRYNAWQRMKPANKRQLKAEGLTSREYQRAGSAAQFKGNRREWRRDLTRKVGQRADDERAARSAGRLRPGELEQLRRDMRFGRGEQQRRSFNRMLWGLGRTDRPDVGYDVGYHG